MTTLARPIWALIASLACITFIPGARAAKADFDAALRADPTLGNLEFDEVEPQRGLILHVELAENAASDRADQIGDELTEIFAGVEKRFKERFGNPGNHAAIHVIVTVDSETWHAARGAETAPSPGGADFLPGLGEHGALVTYDLAWPGSSRRTRLVGLREAFGEALFASHASVAPDLLPGALLAGVGRLVGLDDPNPQAALVRQASAATAPSTAEAKPASSKRKNHRASSAGPARRSGTQPSPSAHDRLIATLVEGGFEDGFLTSGASLFQPQGLGGLWSEARSATTEARDTEHWSEQRFEARVDQATYFLSAGLANETTATSVFEWVTSSLTGGTLDAAALDTIESMAWTRLLTTEHAADLAFDPRSLDGPPAFEAAVVALGLPEAQLTEASGRSEGRLAEGLWLASKGQLEAAHTALLAGTGSATVQRALAGIEAIKALRTSYLAHLADGAVLEKLRIDYDGKLLAADVTRVGRKSVFLAKNSRDIDKLAITAIDIGELVGRMEKEDPVFGDALGRAWAQALVGGKWKRSLSLELKKDKTLNADLEGVTDLLESGRVLHLLAIVDDSVTTGAADRLAAMKDVLATAASAKEVQNSRKHLEEVARELLDKRFAETDLAELLSAKSVERDGDKMSLEYDFSSTAQLADWPLIASYSPAFTTQFPELKTETPRLEIDDDMLIVQGSVAFQHLLAFEQPIRLTYEFRYERTKKKSEARFAATDYVFASICDDLAFQHLRMSQFGNLDIVDNESETNVQQNYDTPLSYKLGKTYELEIELDESGKVTTRLDGDDVFTDDSHGRKAGRLLFLIHSDRVVQLRNVKIEGQLADDQAPLRETWIRGQLIELGF
jgi:hypothetical protein